MGGRTSYSVRPMLPRHKVRSHYLATEVVGGGKTFCEVVVLEGVGTLNSRNEIFVELEKGHVLRVAIEYLGILLHIVDGCIEV